MSSRAGFTLIEAMVATVLAGVVLTLVTSVFMAQNRFFDDVARRSRVQESARAVAGLIQSEARSAGRGSVVQAESRRMALRTPQLIGVVCGVSGSSVDAYLPLDGERIDSTEVAGYGLPEPDGSWSYYPASWGELLASTGGSSVGACEDAGVDTTGAAASDFVRLAGVASEPSPPPSPGGVLMVYREIEYRFMASELGDGALGLYRGPREGTLLEFASGMTADARFEYRLDDESVFRSSVAAEDLARIVTVRVVSTATQLERAPGDPGAYEYGFTLDVPLRNVPF